MTIKLFTSGIDGWRAYRVGTDWLTKKPWYRLERGGVAMAGGPLGHVLRCFDMLKA